MKKTFKYKFFFANLFASFALKKNNNNKILLYHHVNNKFKKDIFSVDKDNFETQISYISKSNMNIKPLCLNHIGSNNISISFDDGYLNNYEFALPILKKYNIPATFFITSSEIDKNNNFLKSSMISEMDKNIFDFGIHGHDHLSLDSLKDQEIEYQIMKCKNFLEDLLNKNIFLLSYPNGSVSERVKSILKKCLITQAYDSTCKSYNQFNNLDILQIPRISIWNIDTEYSFKNKILGKWDNFI